MYNTKEEFLVDFQKFRENNNYPKRDECRNMFRAYRDTEIPEETMCNEVFDYILQQEFPSKFLDSLFKKDNSVCNSDPKLETTQEIKKSEEDYKMEIINIFYAYVKENKSVPSFKVLNSQLGYKVQKYFQDEKDLYYACATVYNISEYLLNEADFSPKYTKDTLELIKKHNRFMVTTAVAGKKVNKLLLKSMLNYAERKDAIILVLPSQDVFNRKSKFEFELDPELKNDRIRVVYEDTYLNKNIMLSDIKISAKSVNPLANLQHLCKYATTIVGSVKGDLEHVPNSPDKIPNAIMCSRCITIPDFSGDAYMSQRLNKLGEEDFVSGAVLVELESEALFHFRQITMDKDGGFIDLGEKYTPEGDRYFVWGSVIVYGDIHSSDIDPNVFECEKEISKVVGADTAIIHDLISCNTVSHHNEGKLVTQARIMQDNGSSLEYEIGQASTVLNEISETVDKVYMVDSNHHDHISGFLQNVRWVLDKINVRYVVDAFVAMLDGEDIPLRYLLNNKSNLSDESKSKIKWLEKDEPLEIYSTSLANHGHLGANGSRGNTLQAYRRAFLSSISAHTHVGRIFRSSMSVGISCKKFLKYNYGLSSWTQGVGILYPNKTKQLINIIEKDGKYSWRI